MLRSRFFWKLFAGYALVIVCAAALIGGLLAPRVENETLAEIDRRLLASATILRDLAERYSGDELSRRVDILGRDLDTRLTIVERQGTVIADSQQRAGLMENHAARPEILQAYADGIGRSTRFSKTRGQKMSYLALPVFDQTGTTVSVARAALPFTLLEARYRGLRNALLLGIAFASLIALGIGFLHARRVVRPLLSMAAVAEQVAAGAHDQRVEAPGRDELGTLARAFNTMTRELRGSLIALATDHDKLTAILASMVEGVIAIDRDERVVHMNQIAGDLLGVDPGKVLSHPVWEITRVHDIPEVLEEVLSSADIIHRVIRLPGAPDRILELRASPLRTTGEITGAVLLLEDVTALRRLETIRRDFVANVSHELKTPVTAIRGLVETLLDDPDADAATQQRFLQRVISQTERMGNLVTDLLSLSRLESGVGGLETEHVDLRHPIHESIRSIQPLAEHRGVEIVDQVPPTEVIVDGDEEALRQAITNLLDNAIKYSGADRVEVRLIPASEDVSAEPATDPEILIEVRDHGVGIDAAHRERLFERFYRVDKARSRQLGGTGLGLAIVKHVTRAHGGRVSVDSQPGRGSTFRMHLPPAPVDS